MAKLPINDRIKQLRKTEMLNQESFANMLSIKRSYVSELETGRKKPSEQLILNICRTFGVDYEWLKFGKGEMYKKTTGLSEKGKEIIRQIESVLGEGTKAPFPISTLAKLFGIDAFVPSKLLVWEKGAPCGTWNMEKEKVVENLGKATYLLAEIFYEGNQEKIDAIMAQLKALKPGPTLEEYIKERKKEKRGGNDHEII